MKIFNWVHKRFNHKPPKDGFASDMKKNEVTISNDDNNKVVGDNEVALLKQVALTNMLGGWKDGILTIGTLGYDHKEYFGLQVQDKKLLGGDGGLNKNKNNNNNNVFDDYAENDDEEVNPLMLNTFEHHNNNFDDDDDDDEEVHVGGGANQIIIDANYNVMTKEEVLINNEIVLADESNDDDDDGESDDVDDDQKKKIVRGERITLADLFLADSEVKKKIMGPTKILVESNDDEKSNLKVKHGKSFAKKLLPNVKDNPQPMKDIKKLMKKMLKRKIHPDFDAKNQKPEKKESIDGNHTKKKEGRKASIYCIPI
ncbi:hypothetical protein HN51_046407 [Arachis hypogaea]|uniref:Protein TILLER ANGLE CONTROL 1 n=1 Tax=Arachis hypogaea TaxID=3818 RepID=A0A445ACD8_ARAHY|nr:transcription initiation factor TFIID subunit 11-like [Arachis ipaensis]XP_025631765.1 transcription initiation factor TFIID subunit 11 [Arachis hypogaea]QHO22556.1 uncharacterized protein DS421_12g356280 [Arachis hypogaea]RYR24130.1 hypothetical protein Ahy_B02g057626 [Arachis hypogaea]